MIANLRLWLAYKICSELRDELRALRNANTKLVLSLNGEGQYLK